MAGGGTEDTFVTITFAEENEDDIVVSVTYSVTNGISAGTATDSMPVVVPRWDPYLPIQMGATGGGIEGAADGQIFAASDEVAFSVLGVDIDRRTGANGDQFPMSVLSADEQLVWMASAGTFVGGDSVGADVTWGSPATGAAGVAISVTANDDGQEVPPGEGGGRDDPDASASVTVDVVQVVVDSISPNTYDTIYNGGDVTITYTILPTSFSAGTGATVRMLNAGGATVYGEAAPCTGGTHSVTWCDTTASLRSLRPDMSPYVAKVDLTWSGGGSCSAVSDPAEATGSVSANESDVSVVAEGGIVECMEERHVTFTATAVNLVGGPGHDIHYEFIFRTADGTYWTQELCTTNLYCEATAVACEVLPGDPDHFFTTPITVAASDDYTHHEIADPLWMGVWELAVTTPSAGCHLMKNGEFSSSCSHSPDCTGFLWTAPVSWGTDWTVTGDTNVSSGTLQLTGEADVGKSAELTVSCQDGEGNSHSASIPISVHRLALLRDGTEEITGNTDLGVVIGERVALGIQVVPADGAPAISGCLWTVPGTRVEGYDEQDDPASNTSSGRENELSDEELQLQNIGFHWVDRGDDRTVTCEAFVGSGSHVVEAEFDVEGPVPSFSCAMADVKVEEWLGPGDWRLSLGKAEECGGPEGITFSHPASPSGGVFRMRQLILSTVHWKQLVSDESWHPAEGSGYLDTNLFMPDNVDSPRVSLLPGQLRYEIETRFATWLMFKPDTPDAIYVPLRKIEWFWSGKAENTGAPGTAYWIRTHQDRSTPDPVSTDTTDFPRWSHNIKYDPPEFE